MLVIFSKLAISARDRDWIDTIRRAYDPQYSLVEPHFTFVFPFTGLSLEEVLPHVREVAKTTPVITFRLAHAAAVDDALSDRSHLFLLPTDGGDELRALHARLYAGVLAPKRHPGIPFEPHVTVGAFKRHDVAERAAASLGTFDSRGALEALQIAEFDGVAVTELHQLSLN